MSAIFKSGALCAVVLSALVLGCGAKSDDSPFGIFNALDPDQVGTWTGLWANSLGDSGTVSIIVSGPGGLGSTLTIALDIDGDVLGTGDPLLEVFTAEINLVDAELDSVASPFFGTLTGTLNAANVLELTSVSVSSPSITSYTVIGGWSSTTLTISATLFMGTDVFATAGAELTKT